MYNTRRRHQRRPPTDRDLPVSQNIGSKLFQKLQEQKKRIEQKKFEMLIKY